MCPECPIKDLGYEVSHNEYFSLSQHNKQLILATFCNTAAGIEVSFWTHGRTDARMHGRTDGRTDRRGSRNSYLDVSIHSV